MEREEEGKRVPERMINRLHEASLSGSLSSLIELIEEDKFILDKVMITFFDETPLHIAAMLGHVDFAREILRRKPEFATELDSESSSPLHLASAKGHLQMVKELLKINPNVCCMTDQDGRTPLHLAAIKGRIDVMKELIQARPEVIHNRVDTGESILHLCVKYNRLEALKLLLESVSDQELINSKDDDGNTALHLATAKKQTKGIKLLLENKVEVNALNGSHFTALDVLAQSPRDMKDMNIGESLRTAGALRAKDMLMQAVNDTRAITARSNAFSSRMTTRSQTQSSPDDYEWLESQKNALMVVSTVIATMAFQAVLSPPGGVWQEDKPNDPNHPNFLFHFPGTSIMASKYPIGYIIFSISNTLSFIASLSITLLLISGLPFRRKIFMWILTVSMWVIIASLVMAYLVSISQLTPGGTLYNSILDVSIYTWVGVVGLVLLHNIARLVLWCVRKYWTKTFRQVSRRQMSIENKSHV